MIRIFLPGILLILSFSSHIIAQQKTFSLDDIFRNGTFRTESLPGFRFMKDGKSYSTLKDNKIQKSDIATGIESGTILNSEVLRAAGFENAYIEDYEFSADESKILVMLNSEPIYRHSSKAIYLVYNRETDKVAKLHDGRLISNATFSPDGLKVAFTFDNNLYYTYLHTGVEVQITGDGKWNHIINGMCDWVYEEEFSFTRAFEWSVDSKKIGFLRFDESNVPQFTIEYFNDSIYPEPYTFKYPKVGEENSTLSVKIFSLETGSTVTIDQKPDKDVYYPRLKWTENSDKLCVFKMNRHQNNLELLLADSRTGATSLLMKEENPYYIEINDYLTFLKDDKHFIWYSDGGGYSQLYLYDMKGNKVRALTTGEVDVTTFYGYDEKNQTLYYQTATPTPMEREIFKISLDGTNKKKISSKRGTNKAQFSTTFDYYVLNHSNINTPPTAVVYDKKDASVRTTISNSASAEKFKNYAYGQTEFLQVTTSSNVTLNGWWIKPSNFDPSKKYPVFMTLYGGPGSQQVLDSWSGGHWWYRLIAEQGYIVACFDNRGTGGRGQEFRKMTYKQLGHYETIDQIECAKYLASQPFVDGSRIGIFGWSYGGYMSSLCLLKGNDVFKSAIAVAPVTNWKWYDSIYTERYMRTEAENPDGYYENSPVYFADRLKGNYFLAHGTADDNVHFQNSTEMVKALTRAGKQFEFHMYPNSNHGIYTDGATMNLYTAMLHFIQNKI